MKCPLLPLLISAAVAAPLAAQTLGPEHDVIAPHIGVSSGVSVGSVIDYASGSIAFWSGDGLFASLVDANGNISRTVKIDGQGASELHAARSGDGFLVVASQKGNAPSMRAIALDRFLQPSRTTTLQTQMLDRFAVACSAGACAIAGTVQDPYVPKTYVTMTTLDGAAILQSTFYQAISMSSMAARSDGFLVTMNGYYGPRRVAFDGSGNYLAQRVARLDCRALQPGPRGYIGVSTRGRNIVAESIDAEGVSKDAITVGLLPGAQYVRAMALSPAGRERIAVIGFSLLKEPSYPPTPAASVFAIRFTEDLRPRDGVPMEITSTIDNREAFAVSSSSGHLIVWNYGPKYAAAFARVGPSPARYSGDPSGHGQPFLRGPFQIGSAAISDEGAQSAIAWGEADAGSKAIRFARLDANDRAIDVPSLALSETALDTSPTIASDGSNFAVLWRDASGIAFALISASGVVLSNHVVMPGHDLVGPLRWSGSEYVVPIYGGTSAPRAVIVNSSGNVVNTFPLTATDHAANVRDLVIAGGLLVAAIDRDGVCNYDALNAFDIDNGTMTATRCADAYASHLAIIPSGFALAGTQGGSVILERFSPTLAKLGTEVTVDYPRTTYGSAGPANAINANAVVWNGYWMAFYDSATGAVGSRVASFADDHTFRALGTRTILGARLNPEGGDVLVARDITP